MFMLLLAHIKYSINIYWISAFKFSYNFQNGNIVNFKEEKRRKKINSMTVNMKNIVFWFSEKKNFI